LFSFVLWFLCSGSDQILPPEIYVDVLKMFDNDVYIRENSNRCLVVIFRAIC